MGRRASEERGAARGWTRALVVGVLLPVLVAVGGCQLVAGPRGQQVGPSPGGPSASAEGQAVVAGPHLSSGGPSTCVVRPMGDLECWGGNSAAQLGAGIRTLHREPVEVAGLGAGVRGVSTGGAHTCVITSSGGVKCWGANSSGQLGDGTLLDSAVPVEVVGLGATVTAISVGAQHTCALTDAGGLQCWGSNSYGELGDGTRVGRATPVVVAGLPTDVAAVSAGVGFTCAVTMRGAVLCWGANGSGQLGDAPRPIAGREGTEEWEVDPLARSRATPTQVAGLGSGVVAVSAGAFHTCAVTTAGGVTCWGSNETGQLGVGALPRYDAEGRLLAGVAFSGVPLDVVGLAAPVVGVTTGHGGHTCAWSAAGDVTCWGNNMGGQLGQGAVPQVDDQGVVRSGSAQSGVPLAVKQLEMKAVAVAAGNWHACALSAEGEVKCWGDNGLGELGGAGEVTVASGVPLGVRRSSSVPSTPEAAHLNLIVVNSDSHSDSDTDTTAGLGPAEKASQTTIAARLIARDPVLLEAIRVGIRAATWGRLDPKVQVSVATKPLKAADEFTDYLNNPELIEDAAQSQRVDGAINVVVAEVTLVGNGGATYGGYDTPVGMPVVAWRSLTSVPQLVHTIVHEYGHDRGLQHAGVAFCEDAVTLAGCDLSPTGDSGSVMSYESTDILTAPELYLLGLLEEHEVALCGRTPGTADFHVSGQTGDGPKLVVVHLRKKGNNDTVYLSTARGVVEVRVDTDTTTRPFKVEDPVFASSLALVSRDTTPKPGDVLLRRLGTTITYQGLDADAQPVVTITKNT